MYGIFAVASYMDSQYLAGLPNDELVKVLHGRKMGRIRDKETNMKDRLERRRHAVWWKWTSRLGWAALGIVAIPLFIAFANFCWLLVLN